MIPLLALLFLLDFAIAEKLSSVELPHEVEEVYCYTSDKNPYTQFTTKTNYQNNHGNIFQLNDPEGCEAVQFWTFNRHGTRYGKESQIEKFENLEDTLDDIRKNYKKGRVELCQADYDLLNSWTWDSNITTSMAKELTPQGFIDLMNIAARFKRKFPELLNVPYSKDNFYFQYTVSNRVRDSYQAYVYGLFGNNSVLVEGTESNAVIKEMEDCNKWEDSEDLTEADEFLESDVYKNMILRVSKRLGFKDKLKKSLVKAMYNNCAYEKAWYPNDISKWCVAFTKEDIEIFEYQDNLENYYSNGYGNKYSQHAGCPVLADLYKRLENTINGAVKEPRVTGLFSHSTEFMLLTSSLGLFRDSYAPLSKHYLVQKGEGWQTSFISPFATNLAVILWKCDNSSYQVQFLLNERPIKIDEKCTTDGICAWDILQKKYEKKVNDCSLDFCTKDNDT